MTLTQDTVIPLVILDIKLNQFLIVEELDISILDYIILTSLLHMSQVLISAISLTYLHSFMNNFLSDYSNN